MLPLDKVIICLTLLNIGPWKFQGDVQVSVMLSCLGHSSAKKSRTKKAPGTRFSDACYFFCSSGHSKVGERVILAVGYQSQPQVNRLGTARAPIALGMKCLAERSLKCLIWNKFFCKPGRPKVGEISNWGSTVHAGEEKALGRYYCGLSVPKR